jgi:dipeptidyl-peptidase-4
VASAAVGGSTFVVVQRSLASVSPVTNVTGPTTSTVLRSVGEDPAIPLRIELLRLGARQLSAALVLPISWSPADGPLPVLLDPYGGPHAQRVLEAGDAHAVSQWFAEAGFAVLVVDGRGTPGRGPGWEREITGDLTITLDDQLAALEALGAARPELVDLGRVGIRGWSFGGYLAALAVLHRPDAVHAAVAGAPVTDWRLYDTHYTERYLGHPGDDEGAYRRSSIVDVPEGTARPLLLIHGLADDNVVAAHTLRLSTALLAAGRAHQVLPLSGVTHMTPQAVVAEQLLRLQRDFLRSALARSL